MLYGNVCTVNKDIPCMTVCFFKGATPSPYFAINCKKLLKSYNKSVAQCLSHDSEIKPIKNIYLPILGQCKLSTLEQDAANRGSGKPWLLIAWEI